MVWLDKNATLCPCEEKSGGRRLEEVISSYEKTRERIATSKYVSWEKCDFRLSRCLFEMLKADELQVANLGPCYRNRRPPSE